MKKTDLVGKFLGDVINEYNMNIKLGAEGGSGFIYCGSTYDMDVEDLDNLIHQSYERTLELSLSTIDKIRKKPKRYIDFCEEMEKIKLEKESKLGHEVEVDASKEAWNIWLRSLDRKLEKARNTANKMRHNIKVFTTIIDREILDAYNSIDEPDTVILLFEGKENGAFWSTEEFQSGQIDYGEDS